MPSNVRLDDGFSTIITFANLPTVKLYEKDVTPPGISAGGAVDTTTMRNVQWRSASPRALKTLMPVKATVAYATEAIPQVMAQIGINQLITITFPDQSNIHFYGWIDEFVPGALTEGAQPTAVITISPGNVNTHGAEVSPVYTAPTLSSGAH